MIASTLWCTGRLCNWILPLLVYIGYERGRDIICLAIVWRCISFSDLNSAVCMEHSIKEKRKCAIYHRRVEAKSIKTMGVASDVDLIHLHLRFLIGSKASVSINNGDITKIFVPPDEPSGSGRRFFERSFDPEPH